MNLLWNIKHPQSHAALSDIQVRYFKFPNCIHRALYIKWFVLPSLLKSKKKKRLCVELFGEKPLIKFDS